MYNFMKNIDLLNYALNGLWLRNKVINHNMSNANTPNYKKLTVNFEDSLKKALYNNNLSINTTHEKHISNLNTIDKNKPTVTVNKGYSYRIDGNNVNIDEESANLAKNGIMYNAVANQVIREFDKLKTVINEGR